MVASAAVAGAACDNDRACTSEEIRACQDGRFCNGPEGCFIARDGGPSCTSSGGICELGQLCDEEADLCYTPECVDDVDCDDSDPCTTDRCEGQRCLRASSCGPGSDGCGCDDGDVCTIADFCEGGSCVGAPKPCPLGLACERDTGDCVDANGACCLPSGLCAETTLDDCDFRVGSYQGSGSACADTTCDVGACCLPSGACSDLTEDACGADGGVYQGDGAQCTAVDCTRGACCNGSACSTLSQSECEAGGGTFTQTGVACAVDTCGEPVACCIATPGSSETEATRRCEPVPDTAACSTSGGSVISGATMCPDVDPSGDFDACLSELSGNWSMRVYDEATGLFSGDAQPWFFTGELVDPGDLLGGYVLVDGRPTTLTSSSGSTNLYYALYTSYQVGGGAITAEGCPLPTDFPGGLYWTARTVSGGTLTRDPCTGECVLSFTETLVTTEPDGDVFTSVFERRSVGRSPVPDGLCYRPCLDTCNAAYLPQKCWRKPPDPPFMTEFADDRDTWAAEVLESRTCLE